MVTSLLEEYEYKMEWYSTWSRRIKILVHLSCYIFACSEYIFHSIDSVAVSCSWRSQRKQVAWTAASCKQELNRKLFGYMIKPIFWHLSYGSSEKRLFHRSISVNNDEIPEIITTTRINPSDKDIPGPSNDVLITDNEIYNCWSSDTIILS